MRIWALLLVGWMAGGVAAVGLVLTGHGGGVLGFGACFALTVAATLAMGRRGSWT